MINIKIKNRILERHIKYLKGSPLCHNIQRLLEKNFLSTLKEEFGEIFVIQHSQFCHCLYEEYQKMDAGNNKNIFVGTPVYLHAFIQKVNQKYGEVQRTIETNQKYADYIYQTFGYDQFVDYHGFIEKPSEIKKAVKYITSENFNSIEDNFKWGAYAYVLSLKIKVCPYCNRNYVLPIYSEEGKMRADLDHFFAKNVYPYLSISIYNLVPSCKYCNSSLKGKKEFTYEGNFHPFDEINADKLYRITYMPKSTYCFLGKEDFDIELEYNQTEKTGRK